MFRLANRIGRAWFSSLMGAQQEFNGLGGDAVRTSRELTVKPTAGRVLSKAQKVFNRLIKRVEALRTEIKTTGARLERALQEHEREVRPRLDALTVVRMELVRTLAPFLDDPRLKRASDRELLEQVVAGLLEDVVNHEGGLADHDLRALFDRVTEPASTAEVAEAQAAFEAMRTHVESMFSEMGVKVDLSDLGPDTTEEELHSRFGQAMHEARERGTGGEPQPRRTQRPTRKQLEREARLRGTEETRKRTIGVIYKQLAKTLHPDLEPDPARRVEKLVLMQELTAAHRANDLYALLRLELEWLHREEGDLDRLTDEKLAVYVAVLREQVVGLEQELAALGHHPRFQPLVMDDDMFRSRVDLNPGRRVVAIETITCSMREDLERLQGPGALREVRALLKTVRAQRRRVRHPLF